MSKEFFNEQWKTIEIDLEYIKNGRLEISNYGRMRSFNRMSDGNILKGSMINGYKILRLKLFSPRTPEMQAKIDFLRQQYYKLLKKLKLQISNDESKQIIEDTTLTLLTLRKNLTKKIDDDVKQRTIHYHALFHRLVATYFLPPHAPNQTIVAHLDYEKLNNKWSNLKWMTPEENYEHQKNSPNVLEEMELRQHRRKEDSKATKLSVTKVMLLKKLLNQGKTVKQLSKQFKVTDTQIMRIKRGENWGDVEAAK